MTDYFLKFNSEAEAKAVLYRVEGATPADPETGTPATEGYEVLNFANIDTVGIIYKPTGEMLQGEDGAYPAMAPIPGWHVNVRVMPGEDVTLIEPHMVTPTLPVRVWG